MKAELIFKSRHDALDFARRWTFYSKRGHTTGAGTESVKITLHDVTEREKQWIDKQIAGSEEA